VEHPEPDHDGWIHHNASWERADHEGKMRHVHLRYSVRKTDAAPVVNLDKVGHSLLRGPTSRLIASLWTEQVGPIRSLHCRGQGALVIMMASEEAVTAMARSNGTAFELGTGSILAGGLPWRCHHEAFDVNPSAILRRVVSVHAGKYHPRQVHIVTEAIG
jgi:hypothetical protein